MLSIHVSCVASCVLTTHFIYMGFFAIIFCSSLDPWPCVHLLHGSGNSKGNTVIIVGLVFCLLFFFVFFFGPLLFS